MRRNAAIILSRMLQMGIGQPKEKEMFTSVRYKDAFIHTTNGKITSIQLIGENPVEYTQSKWVSIQTAKRHIRELLRPVEVERKTIHIVRFGAAHCGQAGFSKSSWVYFTQLPKGKGLRLSANFCKRCAKIEREKREV